MIEVRDGARTLQFDGALIAESSSERAGSDRWVEFKLYKTLGGSYVLSRVGVSALYHVADCRTAQKYRLKPGDLSDISRPCPDCHPDLSNASELYPETLRHWAQRSDDPQGVMEALYKEDPDGVWYLTKVARRLLETAAVTDEKIRSAYMVERIR